MTHREALIRVDEQMLDDAHSARSSRGVFNSNLLYDQQGILMRYMGLSEDLWLPAKLQSGWGTKTHGEFFDRDLIKSSKAPVLAWGNRFHDDLLKYDVESSMIGAPILYKDIDVSWIEPDRNSAIYFPIHSVDNITITNFQSLGDIRKDITADRITMCLHINDYKPEIIYMMKAFGFDCTTVGATHRQGFFWRCLALMAAHGYVATNVISTVAFYAALADRPCVVSGQTPTFTHEWPVVSREWTQENFPEFLTLGNHVKASMRELGVKYKRGPSKLRQLILSAKDEWADEERLYENLWTHQKSLE